MHSWYSAHYFYPNLQLRNTFINGVELYLFNLVQLFGFSEPFIKEDEAWLNQNQQRNSILQNKSSLEEVHKQNDEIPLKTLKIVEKFITKSFHQKELEQENVVHQKEVKTPILSLSFNSKVEKIELPISSINATKKVKIDSSVEPPLNKWDDKSTLKRQKEMSTTALQNQELEKHSLQSKDLSTTFEDLKINVAWSNLPKSNSHKSLADIIKDEKKLVAKEPSAITKRYADLVGEQKNTMHEWNVAG